MKTVLWITMESAGVPFFQAQTIATSLSSHCREARRIFAEENPGKDLPLRITYSTELVKVLCD